MAPKGPRSRYLNLVHAVVVIILLGWDLERASARDFLSEIGVVNAARWRMLMYLNALGIDRAVVADKIVVGPGEEGKELLDQP